MRVQGLELRGSSFGSPELNSTQIRFILLSSYDSMPWRLEELKIMLYVLVRQLERSAIPAFEA